MTNYVAEIISYNMENDAVCAASAKISTTKGNAHDLFTSSKGNPKNLDLIQKVLNSGHRSLIEHAVFTIAFSNVSAYVEQYLIECRLASFTIKSRRYVDFSHFGYVIPPELENEALSQYCTYMDMMFAGYREMLEAGIPKEDARFLLPYSFHSNFYCTMNARELAQVISHIKYGRGAGIGELQLIADQLIEQLHSIFPPLCAEIEQLSYLEIQGDTGKLKGVVEQEPTFLSAEQVGTVHLLSTPTNPKMLLETAVSTGNPMGQSDLDIPNLLQSPRPRALEQLSYGFSISNLTLSGLTHIARHRMQSIVIPSIQTINYSKHIVPHTVAKDSAIRLRYQSILQKANELLLSIEQNDCINPYQYYFALSGNLMDIMTTMNGRELALFIRLRTCTRAQWEIRDIAISMLKQLRGSFPELFSYYGPSCFMDGRCPEGNLSCKKMLEVQKKFD